MGTPAAAAPARDSFLPPAQASPASPWYTPGGLYGADESMIGTGVVREIDKNNPRGVYEAFLANKQLGGFDAKSQFAQGLYNRFLSGFGAAQRENPELTFERYLRGQTKRGMIDDLWAGLTPTQRGENQSLFAPRTRVIRQG